LRRIILLFLIRLPSTPTRSHLWSRASQRAQNCDRNGAESGLLLFRQHVLPTVDRLSLMNSSDRMLSEAGCKISLRPVKDRERIQLRVADATRLPYANDSFDTVVDTFGLCSFDNLVSVLQEMARFCRKDTGIILLLEHGTTESWEGLARYLDRNAERRARNWVCVSTERCGTSSRKLTSKWTRWSLGTSELRIT